MCVCVCVDVDVDVDVDVYVYVYVYVSLCLKDLGPIITAIRIDNEKGRLPDVST
jgi:hypothetical protein